ncbi:hypothetical protein ABPG74_021325 [Tetrahymena malaccensis]
MIFHEDIINLGEKPYEYKDFFTMDSKIQEDNIKLSYFHTAVAKYGGPIALMRNKNKIVPNLKTSVLNNELCFLSSDGVIFNHIKLDYQGRDVVCFDFLQNELLLILTSNPPAYYLVDPFRNEQNLKPYNLDTKFQSNLYQAKVFGNGFAFCAKITNQNQPEEIRFFYVDNLHMQAREKFIQEKAFYKSGIKEMPRDWIVMTKDQSELKTLEIQMTHPESGVISITETNRKLYYQIPEINQPDKAAAQPKQISSSLPPIKNIQFIALSPSNSLIAYLQEVGNGKIKLSVLSNDYEAKRYTVCDVDLKGLKLPNTITSKESQLQMMWCGDDCCVLQIDQSILMIGPDVTELIEIKEDFIMSKEVDGIRIVTKKGDKLLRSLPDAFLNVYPEYISNWDQQKPAAKLLQNYQNLKSKQPFDDSDLRSNPTQLRQAVKDCMTVAAFITDEEKQKDLLKAASYGKTYLGPDAINHDEFGLLCQKLRVVYNFREVSIKRMITCAQVNNLLSGDLQQQLINIMLRYDYHELAFNVCNQLDFKPKVRTYIFEHWAERVIEKSSAASRQPEQRNSNDLGGSGGNKDSWGSMYNADYEDNRVAEKIISKLRNEKNVSFVNIAKRATKECRQNLAMKLLYQEPSAFKRVPVLIWMGKNCLEFETNALTQSGLDRNEIEEKLKSKEWKEDVQTRQARHYENALQQALQSRDSELIYMCLKEMDTYMKNETLKFHVLKSEQIYANHYKNYLKNSNSQTKQERYKNFINYCNNDQGLEKISYFIKNSFQTSYKKSTKENLINRHENLRQALKEINQKKIDDSFLGQAILKEIQSLEYILGSPTDELNKHFIDEILEWTVNKSLSETLARDAKQIKDKIKDFNVSQKRTDFLKVRNLIKEKDYEQLEFFLVKEVNKKNVVIPYELVADLLIKEGAKEQAVRLILNIPKMEERVTILLKIDEAKRAVQDVINSRKNLDLLEMIREQCRDPSVISYMEHQLQQSGLRK